MVAAQMAQQIVRAAHEVTEEREVITEVTTEQIEIIKKPEVAKNLMAPVFEIPLQDIMVSDAERAVFECRVTGVPMPSVTWYVDSKVGFTHFYLQPTLCITVSVFQIEPVLPSETDKKVFGRANNGSSPSCLFSATSEFLNFSNRTIIKGDTTTFVK